MPTDAFDMAIVHKVFRSELHDVPTLIRNVTAGDTARSAVVASHIELITAALHHHHAAEDELIWPKLHCRATEFAEAVARMEQAHRAIAAADAKVKSVLTSWVRTADAGLAAQLLDAVADLSARVDEHLADEERNIVPLINQHLTVEEWQQCAARGSELISRKNFRLGLVLGGLTFDASSADEARRILNHIPLLQRIAVRLLARRTLDRYRAVLYGTQATALSTRRGVQGRDVAEPSAREIIENFRTCELTTMSRDGSPQTWPICPLLLPDGRFLLCTSIGLPQKAFNIRRNPKVSMLFSEPTGSGFDNPGAVLVQGDAIAEDRIVADLRENRDLRRLFEQVCARQPASAFMSSWLGRRLFPFYYVRLAIQVTPYRILHWPTRDFSQSPRRVDVEELSYVG
ncbi:hemerythrin domain-containing protein [Mycobacterium sp. SVM_VP21]|nr:hemerythrin domain-containing protein [Mycobacterium sp. SVM_VP21]